MLGDMFDLWVKNLLNFFVVFLGVSLAIGALTGLLGLALFGRVVSAGGIIPTSPTTADLGMLILFVTAAAVISAVVNSLVVGSMTEYAVRRHRGESVSLEQAFRRGSERLPSVLGATLLLNLVVFTLVILPFVLLLPVAAGTTPNPSLSQLFLLCGLLLAVIVGGVVAIFVYVALSLYPAAIMFENAGAVPSLTRSWELTRGHRWRLFAAILVTVILAGIISAAVTVPAGMVQDPIVDIVAAAFAAGLVGSWILILTSVAYDLIIRGPRSLFGPGAPYVPTAPIAPPPGAAQVPPTPPAAPPPAGP